MSKYMQHMEKLTHFTTKGDELRKRAVALQAETAALDKEFTEWLQKDVGVEGQLHLSDVLKNVLEKCYEPIITKG